MSPPPPSPLAPNSVDHYFGTNRSHRHGSFPSVKSVPHSKYPSFSLRMPFSRHDKRWHWWHALYLFLFVLGCLQITISLAGQTLEETSVPLVARQYPRLSYQAINTTEPIVLPRTTVYHVTEEFGWADNAGAVTALIAAQLNQSLDVSVIMPYYSFLKPMYTTVERSADLTIDVRTPDGKTIPIEFKVWIAMHDLEDSEDTEESENSNENSSENTSENTSENSSEKEEESQATAIGEQRKRLQVPVYLIGPGNRSPFTQAFKAKNVMAIHTPHPLLSSEWREQFFSKAAAALIAHRVMAKDEVSLFAPLTAHPTIDVIHCHGAHTAHVLQHLHTKRSNNALGPQPPVFVYTMNNAEDLQTVHTLSNILKFMEVSEWGVTPEQTALSLQKTQTALEAQSYVHGQHMALAGLGVQLADVVTINSQSMALDIVHGQPTFQRQDLVMPSLLTKAHHRQFFGISQGLQFSTSPFNHPDLVTRNLVFPEFALDVLNQAQWTARTVWTLGGTSPEFVGYAKDKIRKHLVRRKVLVEADLQRPLVLFAGELTIADMKTIELSAECFENYNMRLVLLGEGEALNQATALATRYQNIIVLSTPKQIRQWSVFCKAAADVVLMPGTNADAMEAMLYGASVLAPYSSNALDVLQDRPEWKVEGVFRRDVRISRDKITKIPTVSSSETFNAYLFNHANMETAIADFERDWKRTKESKTLQEEYVLRMMYSTLSLDWEREGGPVEEYMHVYQLALADRHMPTATQHVLQEEQIVLRRLLSATS
ncbi:hypothetical protein BDF14DRAFT_1792334 [Spinellus fusiger]|nr:hypothetical protein BDF14DRAFT_1792334 [Spinellus fusiger]